MIRHALLVVLAILAGGCGGGAALAPLDPPAPLSDLQPTLDVKAVWAREIDDGVGRQFLRLPPLVDAQRIYAASHGGRLFSFEVDSGRRIWTVDIEATINSGPAEGGELLLLGGDAEVIAVGKEDGQIRWRAPVSSEVLAAPQRAAQIIIARTVDGAVFALSARNGERLWQFRQEVPLLTLRGVGRAVIAGDVVVAGFANGQVTALHLPSGARLWETAVAVPRGRTELERIVDVDADLQVDEGVVYVSSYRGKTAALALGDGRPLWEREIGSYSGIALSRDALYLTDVHGDVWALSRSNGGTLWRQSALHGRGLSAPATQGGYLVVGDFEGYLHWLAREDGRLAARVRVRHPDDYAPVSLSELTDNGFPQDRRILAAPVVEAARVYALDKRGALNVFQVSLLKP